MNILRRSRSTKIAAFALCSCVAGVLVATPQKKGKPDKPGSSCEVLETPYFTLVATLSSPVANRGLGRNIGVATLDPDVLTSPVVAAVVPWNETDTVEVFLLDPGMQLPQQHFSLHVPPGRYTHVAVADVNSDFLPDIVVRDLGAGRVLLFLANTDGTDGYQAAIKLLAPSAEDAGTFGVSLAVGDLVGDPTPDIVVGAPADGTKFSGKVFIFDLDDKTYCPDSLTTLCIKASLTIDGADRDGTGGDRFGMSVAVGDVTGWGNDDLIVSADRADGETKKEGDVGKVWVFPGPLDADPDAEPPPPSPFLLAQGAKNNPLGNKVAVADLTGGWDADVVATIWSKEALVFAGPFLGVGEVLLEDAVALLPDPRLTSTRGFGTAIAAGHIDDIGDNGFPDPPDLIVGAAGATPPGCNGFIGAAQVYLNDVGGSDPGHRSGLLLQPPDTEGAHYGIGVAAANTLVFVGEPSRDVDVVDEFGNLVEVVEGAGLVYVYKLTDTDGDGVPDFRDN